MITCKLYGRRANQLFQIASLIGVALESNIPWAIPRYTENEEAFPHRHFKALEDIGAYLDTENLKKPFYYLKEAGHNYNVIAPEVLRDLTNQYTVVLDGYFQSYKYFEKHKMYIAQLLGFPTNFHYSTGEVAIHVRRGDYLNLPDKHPVLPLSYYERAVDIFKSLNKKHFKVFSDDLDWCRENFLNINNPVFSDCRFIFSDNANEMQDLYEMFTCDGYIIANSSFSLFAAILGQRGLKTVVSPHYKQWFGENNQHLDTSDMLPPSFTLLNYNK